MIDWFSKWNRDNPVDVYRSAILYGVGGTVIIAAVAVVTLGQPWATDSLQTGPRGNGMMVTKRASQLAAPDPAIAAFLATSTDPVPPTLGGRTAGSQVEGAEPLLADLSPENYERLVTAMRAWTGIPDLLSDPESYQTVVARRMIQMTQNINESWDGHVNANKQVGVTCYTCHRGQPVPQGAWFIATPTVQAAEGWSAVQNRVTPLSSYTSLPSDALQKYLVDGELIAVHDLESRAAGIPGQDGYPGIQKAERTYALMNYFANSLGVNCTLCHNTRAFYDGGQITPQWATASLGILMVQELNNDYLLPLAEVLPPERLGPHGDGPKVACNTCHRGEQQPLRGTDVIGNYPELATTEAPDYGN
ncbi:MAG: photosynthetic reaction center cytochrome c subunit [Rhodobacteraceae bacterium]|nr:photosynthetic reaction center cytochrome c subunit [Paracoccaceae bacterium]MAY46813.1 photosynthetic reaction center cytochrome c subunit [Paracoccaceae bacterium]